MQIEFSEELHEYTVDDERFPSITQVLGDEGMADFLFASMADRDRGSAVHRVTEIIDMKPWEGATVEEIVANSRWDPDSTSATLIPYGYAYAQFLLDTGFRSKVVEGKVASKAYRVAGRFDRWGLTASGKRWLVDLKSGQPTDAAWVQVALYAHCAKETHGLDTDEVAIVWLKRDGSYKLFGPPRPPSGTDLQIGFCAINLWWWRHQHNCF